MSDTIDAVIDEFAARLSPLLDMDADEAALILREAVYGVMAKCDTKLWRDVMRLYKPLLEEA